MHNTIFYYIKKFITTAATTYKKSKQCQMLFRMKKCVPLPPGKCLQLTASFEELPKHPVHFISSPPTSSEPGPQDKVTGFVRMLLFRDREVWMALDSTKLSNTCNAPPIPNRDETSCYCSGNTSAQGTKATHEGAHESCFSIKISQKWKYSHMWALLPNPNLHLHIFNPSEHWLCQQVRQRRI